MDAGKDPRDHRAMTLLVVFLLLVALAAAGRFFGVDSRHGPEWTWGGPDGPYRASRW